MSKLAHKNVAPPRRARSSLTRDEILSAAQQICATESLDLLTMKRVADALGAGTTSIYWYFRSKHELLSALTDETLNRLSQLMPSPEHGTWAAALYQHFDSYRSIMQTDPTMIDLVIVHGDHYSERSTILLGELIEPLLSRLVQAGFSPTTATECYLTLSHYTRGVLLVDAQLRAAGKSAGSNHSSLAGHELHLAAQTSSDLRSSDLGSTGADEPAKVDAHFQTGLRAIIRTYSSDLAA